MHPLYPESDSKKIRSHRDNDLNIDQFFPSIHKDDNTISTAFEML